MAARREHRLHAPAPRRRPTRRRGAGRSVGARSPALGGELRSAIVLRHEQCRHDHRGAVQTRSPCVCSCCVSRPDSSVFEATTKRCCPDMTILESLSRTTAAPAMAMNNRAAAQANALARRAPAGVVGACGAIALGMVAMLGSPAKLLDATPARFNASATAGGSSAATVRVSQIAGLATTGTYR